MAILLRWWRSLLDLLPLHGDDSARWVEPANDITRAILSGQTLWLPELAETAPVVTETPAVPDVAVEVATPTLPEIAAEMEEAAPAAEERRETPATRTRRRRGRRAA